MELSYFKRHWECISTWGRNQNIKGFRFETASSVRDMPGNNQSLNRILSTSALFSSKNLTIASKILFPALDHSKQININMFIINLIVLLITHLILDCFRWSGACFDWRTCGFTGRTKHRYSQKYPGVLHSCSLSIPVSLFIEHCTFSTGAQG